MKKNYLLTQFLAVIILICVCLMLLFIVREENTAPLDGISSKQNGAHLVKKPFRPRKPVVSKNTIKGTTRLRVKRIYDAQLGVREATGHNDGEEVVQYLHYIGLGKGYAWCAAFVSWVYGKAGVENPKTVWAASLFPKDKLVWKQGKKVARAYNHDVQSASIFGIYFNSIKRIGHCGFVDEWGETVAITVEGNTNDNGSREGDGVYRKRRPINSIYAVADWIVEEDEQ